MRFLFVSLINWGNFTLKPMQNRFFSVQLKLVGVRILC